jgi:TolA-binding protein
MLPIFTTFYAYPKNQQKDYQKSLECFQKLIKDYPGSEYRQDSEVMISLIKEVTRKISLTNEVISKGNKITTQQKQIQTLEQQVKELEKKIEQIKEVDMNLKEKKKSLPEQK